MFGKLIKYEMKSMMKVFAIAWAAILGVALISGLSMANDSFMAVGISPVGEWIEFISTMLYICLAIALVVLTMVFVISRFGKGLLGDEGYLMFTLPVTVRKLITAKGLSAAIIVIISCVVGIVSVFFFAFPSMDSGDVTLVFGAFSELVEGYPVMIPVIIECIIITILWVINFIYHIYASIAIGHLSSKHRVLFSVIAFLGISVAIEIILAIAGSVFDNFGFLQEIVVSTINDLSGITILFALVCVIEIAGIVLFHIITEYILNRKLNLL